MQGGGGPAEPVLSKQSELTDGVKATAKGGEPAPVRVSETGRARNWTMPPLRLEREWREHSAEQNDLLSFCERRNSATIDNRCVEFDRRENQRCAFTMAEILLSLTIIGVVAAITLPSLTGNINERTWNTQRKALYARFSQAVSLMDSMNGYADAETFVTAGLSKVLKINNVCDYDHLEDCGITSKQITDNAGNPTSMPKLVSELNPKNTSMSFTDTHGTTPVDYSYSNVDTEAAAFETQNGESILAFYNPSCSADMQETDYYGASKVCANFVYDLNGSKGPNAVGKDIGVMTVLYPSDSLVVAPMLYPRNAGVEVDFNEAPKACTALDAEYRVPNIGEVISMFYNSKLLNIESSHYWSSSRYDSSKAWNMSGTTGRIFLEPIDETGAKRVKCVKRN